ncbi:hypothetical protein [Altericista sp. CCNU0014]|uniref:hypothetical protein n=1 Tax=Altericista sp. CCNU0014 TaxID=3082949 RepID=UPI0038517976
MNNPLKPKSDSLSSAATIDPETLKLWLCELTHLSPQQIDRVLDQREPQQASLLSPQTESARGT